MDRSFYETEVTKLLSEFQNNESALDHLRNKTIDLLFEVKSEEVMYTIYDYVMAQL